MIAEIKIEILNAVKSTYKGTVLRQLAEVEVTCGNLIITY
jgi:hypothetical protein